MTKKRSSEILGVKIDIFPWKRRHSEILVREKIFRPPQTRRQVSAADFGKRNYKKYINYMISSIFSFKL